MTMHPLTGLEIELIEHWQRGLPLEPRPYAAMAERLGVAEKAVITALGHLYDAGILSRVGATLRPNTAGASLLAAMCVPRGRLDEVAAIVNAEPGVNHNYEREHEINLWFVVTGRDRAALDTALARIRAASGIDVLELPLVKSYHIDLGFSIGRGAPSPLGDRDGMTGRVAVADLPEPAEFPRAGDPLQDQDTAATTRVERQASVDTHDICLLQALEHGLTLDPAPYAALAARCGATEADVISRIGRLVDMGVISRFGLIVRHRALGITANAMAVWDVADEDVDGIGACLAREPAVNLCYRRPRRLPDWPFNLFCMVHGRERDEVRGEIAAMAGRAGLDRLPNAVLFSRRCFRQRGPSLRAA